MADQMQRSGRGASGTSEPIAKNVETVKALGRIAFRHLKDGEIFGNIAVGGEQKQMRILEEDGLSVELLEPSRGGASQTEHSQIRIRFHGRKVFDIRWDPGGVFKAVHFEPAMGERVLIDLLEPIPF